MVMRTTGNCNYYPGTTRSAKVIPFFGGDGLIRWTGTDSFTRINSLLTEMHLWRSLHYDGARVFFLFINYYFGILLQQHRDTGRDFRCKILHSFAGRDSEILPRNRDRSFFESSEHTNEPPGQT